MFMYNNYVFYSNIKKIQKKNHVWVWFAKLTESNILPTRKIYRYCGQWARP